MIYPARLHDSDRNHGEWCEGRARETLFEYIRLPLDGLINHTDRSQLTADIGSSMLVQLTVLCVFRFLRFNVARARLGTGVVDLGGADLGQRILGGSLSFAMRLERLSSTREEVSCVSCASVARRSSNVVNISHSRRARVQPAYVTSGESA